MTETPFHGLVAVVTGAASGIGLATGARLRDDGASVVGIDKAFSSSDGMRGAKLHCDVSKPADVRAAATAVLEDHGRCDVLVNCAGVAPVGDALTCQEEDWDLAFSVNVKGTWLMCQAFLGSMVDAGAGAIVNVASGAGIRPAASMAAYSASKAAVVSLTRSIARDFGSQGVRANALCPGPVDTKLHHETSALRHERNGAESDDGLNRHDPADVGEMAAYIALLASPASRSITAAALVADCGRVMH